MARDLSHHLSEESKRRRESPLKKASLHLKDGMLALSGGLPNPDYFPFANIKAEVATLGAFRPEEIRDSPTELVVHGRNAKLDEPVVDLQVALQYGQGTGQTLLLKFCKEHTEIFHSPPYSDWACIMTAGCTNSMDSVFRTLANPGETVIVETYAFPSSLECLHPMGVKVTPVELDGFGITTDSLEHVLATWNPDEHDGSPRPHLLYTVPSGQNPTGATATLERRRAIYDICCRYDVVIVEDEPYYFLQMQPYVSDSAAAAPPLPSDTAELRESLVPSYVSIDVEGRVVRMDSFSKVIAPGSRCGFITANTRLIERIHRQNEVSIQAPSGFSQALLNALFNYWGHDGYVSWLIYIRAAYTERRNALLRSMEQLLPREIVTWVPPSAGMFIWLTVDAMRHPEYHTSPGGALAIEDKVYRRAISYGALVACGSWFAVDPARANELHFRLTFVSAKFDTMHTAVERFARALRDEFQLS